ncbi:ABC-type multidrug transport system fused ATPase/permease subunit [Ruminiclostridium sufflavum DSM 19573]|uniref:ABC-type multidrug transport system fused ATPase/permease subunit n=1 Tax=Ruminiclostridium sufflavum DSM 19573 TaxID=1121337 RepID=A0A318Y3S5_9FIRM|nr:ABC transporter ATP-binding protein [Ruminiclostridium sufflavum]PYG90228.1 ABC-type multidrug transport system fused ATPase/permease subunit [Ruminiclostridium sufflavum DSM 19573]
MKNTGSMRLLPAFLWMYRYVKPYRLWLFTGILSSVIVVFLNIVKADVINRLISNALSLKNNFLYTLGLIFVIVLISGAFFSYLLKYSVGRFGVFAARDLKNSVVSHISGLETGAVGEIHSGTLVSRFNNDLQAIEGFINGNLVNMLFQPVMFICSIAYMGAVNWKLLVASFIFTPVSVYFSNRLGGKIGVHSKEYLEHMGSAAGIIKDSISGIETVKSYNLADYLMGKCRGYFEKARNKAVCIERCKMHLFPFVIILMEIPGVICILFGGYLTLNGEMSVGELVAFFQMLNYVVQPSTMIPWLITDIKNTGGAIENINTLFLKKSERSSGEDYTARNGYAVEFENVCFTYNGGTEVLKGADFKISAGDKVAIVGASGNGKSTLLNILCGFYEVSSGKVKVFGEETGKWSLEALRRKIAYISQDAFLYPASIYENILYGNPAAPERCVSEAAETAHAHEFISSLPESFNTIAGDGGIKLSGGQKQRIAIARAVLKNAPIILMDEPTSALDSQSEELVYDTVFKCSGDKTVLVVAHRLSAIKWADYYIVIDEGVVKEQGSYEELMKADGVFRRLYDMQTKDSGYMEYESLNAGAGGENVI